MNALLVQAILDHLAAERAAILQGEFSALAVLQEKKVPLFDRLAQSSGLAAPDLDQIGAGVSCNQRLLTAAMEGVRQAGARINAMSDARDTFRTYDQHGQTRDVAQNQPAFERKA